MKFYHPVIEKHKNLNANERSTDQLLEHFKKTDKDPSKTYRCTQESHVTLF